MINTDWNKMAVPDSTMTIPDSTKMTSDPGTSRPIARLRWIMETLRAKEGGCPWDLKQDHFTLKPYLMEEACEVIDAIDEEDDDELCKELGDLLLQIVFLRNSKYVLRNRHHKRRESYD